MTLWRPFRIGSITLLLFLLIAGCAGGAGNTSEGGSGGQASKEQASKEQSSGERSSGEEGSGGGAGSGERTSGGETTKEETVPGAISAYGEGTTGGEATMAMAGETTTGGETTSGEMTSGETTGSLAGAAEGAKSDGEGSGEGSGKKVDEESGLLLSETLAAGAKDTTGGPLVEKRMVSYYGHPLAGAMGVLGQLEPPQMVDQLKEQAAVWTRLDPDRPAIPTIELIASVAQPAPGPDGLYLTPTDTFWIDKYAKLAEENDCLLLLDVQIGYSTIADEIERLMPYLEQPNVHLAIDPEYDMSAGEVPGQQFGSSTGREIMAAAKTLSKLVEEKDLPPKVLVIHQFRYDMIVNKQAIKPVKNVEIVVHADGFGSPEAKITKYDALVRDQPIQYGGFKLFYDQDYPLMSPRKVMKALEPDPAVISYQ